MIIIVMQDIINNQERLRNKLKVVFNLNWHFLAT